MVEIKWRSLFSCRGREGESISSSTWRFCTYRHSLSLTHAYSENDWAPLIMVLIPCIKIGVSWKSENIILLNVHIIPQSSKLIEYPTLLSTPISPTYLAIMSGGSQSPKCQKKKINVTRTFSARKVVAAYLHTHVPLTCMSLVYLVS